MSIRLLHHFACTGGTLISRCLAALPNVRMLSEVDPLSTMAAELTDFRPTDLIGLSLSGTHPATNTVKAAMFEAALVELHEDSVVHGLDLVLRDHAHSHFCERLDFTQRPSLRDMVIKVSPVRSLVTVRHPIDSFLALQKNQWITFDPPCFGEYLRRYAAFLDAYEGLPIMRYEDFVAAPEPWLRTASETLNLVYSPMFLLLFPAIELSGDSGRSGHTIAPRPRRPVPDSLAAEIGTLPLYPELLARMGYAE